MSGSDLAIAAVAVACFYSYGWCLSLARRLCRIERTSKLDPLTGLGSGDWLHRERWPAALRSGRPLGVLFVDLDHLKRSHNALGHGVGAEDIRTAANTLGKAVRRGVDEVFRTNQSGEEFEVLMHGAIGDLNRCAWSLLQRMSERGVSASLGLAYTTATGFVPTRAELRAAAEAACREAKKRGGGCAIVAGHGVVTAPEGDTPSCGDRLSRRVPVPPDARSEPAQDAVPCPIYEEAMTEALTPAAQAALAAPSGDDPSSAAERQEQAQADGARIWRKREAAGWTRRKLSEVCRESESTLKDIELGRKPIATTTRVKIEACLDAELAKLGLVIEKP